MAVGQLNVELQLDTSGMVAALRESQERLASVGREASRQMTIVRSEFNTATLRMDENTDATERLTTQQRYLGQRLEQQRTVIDLLNDTYQRSVQVNGENAESTQRLAVRLARAREEETRTESQIRDTNRQLQEQADAADDVGDSVQNLSQRLSGIGERMKGIGEKLSVGISAPIAGFMLMATEGTKELRKELALLQTNAEMAGASVQGVNDAYRTLNGVRDDLEANSETISELLASGFKGNDLQKALEGVIGAGIKFKDTLNFEGIADGIQETLGTSAAAGSFLELLERMGVKIDDFNAGLTTATANGTQLQYVLDTMAKLGLSDVYNKYLEINGAMVDSAKATYDAQVAMAELGKTVQPIITDITTKIADMLGEFNKLPKISQDITLAAGGILFILGPILFGFSQLLIVAPKIIGFFTWFAGLQITGTLWTGIRLIALTLTSLASVVLPAIGAAFVAAFEIVTAPITLVTLTIAGIVALGYQLYKNWDELKKLGLDVWKGISDATGIAVDYIKSAWQDFSNFFISLWQSIWNPVKAVLNNMIEGINYVIAGLNKISISAPDWDILPDSIQGKTWSVNIGKIPKLHTGGVYEAPFGQSEGLALLADGERVLTEGQSTNSGIDYNRMAAAIAQGLAGAKFVSDINSGTVEMIVGGILRREVRI